MEISPENWENVKALFEAALDLAPHERVSLLGSESVDPRVREEVERLLAEHDRARSFLSNPAYANLKLDQTENQGRFVPGELLDGKFRISRMLAEGGMGQVWLAEQTAPLQRPVVVKLIKAGMYDAALLERFRSERQSLAIMDHPSIAKVFDAGTTSEGQPYFVMEYVPGQPITNYCDEKRLSVRDRLELFTKVCEGVQHAHQKAIIHRDLKPANILVVEVDGKPAPRIIDFGIAKGTSPLAGQAEFTRAGGFVGTPGYMSPEQTNPSTGDVDTRTDVYSLGAILYVLLSGSLPFGTKEWQKQPLDEMLRRLREDDPPRPSTKVSTEHETAGATAEARGTDARQLVSLLRGDLDWITMKALEKDRGRRYGTPSELAADINRYLNNEPVVARPASTSYRVRKYVRRHGIGVAVAASVAGLLVAFGVMQTAQLRRTTRERDRANRERDRATRITDFMAGMFKISDPSEARGNSLTAREVLDKASKEIDSGLARDPELQAQMMYVMGKVYDNLGLYPRAHSLQEKTIEIRRRVLGPESPETLKSMVAFGWVLDHEGRYPEAETLLRRSLEEERQVLGPEHRDTLASVEAVANVLLHEGRYAESEKLFRQTLEVQLHMFGAEDTDSISSKINLAAVLFSEGQYAESEQLNRQVFEVQRRALGPEHPDTLTVMNNLALDLNDEGNFAEAERLDREIADIRRRVLGPEHPLTLASMGNTANVLENEGNYIEAEKLDRQTLDIRRRVLGPGHPDTLLSMSNLAEVVELEGHYAEAEKLDRKVLDDQRHLLGPEHPSTLLTMNNLARVLAQENHNVEAEKLYRETVEASRRTLGQEHMDTVMQTINLAAVLIRENQYAEAEKLTRQALEISRRVFGPDHPMTASSTYNFATISAHRGRREEAFSLLRDAIDHGLPTFADLGIENDPDLKSLHSDPRCDALVAYAKQRAAAALKPK